MPLILIQEVQLYCWGAHLLILTGLRTGELRAGEWREVDFDNAVWEIPKERMKMRRSHIVPLPKQALSHLKSLKELTGNYPLMFPWTQRS